MGASNERPIRTEDSRGRGRGGAYMRRHTNWRRQPENQQMPDTQTAHTSEMDSVDLWAKAYACSHMANIETVWALRDGRELPRGWRCSLSLAFIALAAFERRHDDVAHLRDKGPSRRERYHESRDWGGYVYDADQREARGEAR